MNAAADAIVNLPNSAQVGGAAILLAYPAVHPVLAIVFASVISMFVSYAGYRLGVFPSPKSNS